MKKFFSFLVLTLVALLSAGMASAQTHAYITDQVNDSILVYDASTLAFLTSVPVGPGDPERIAVTPNQAFAYATLRDAGQVAVIDTSTNMLVTNVTVGTTPGDVAITPNGASVYVANAGSDSLSVISTATNSVTATVPLSSGAYWIGMSADGASVYVSLTSESKVAVVSTATNTVTATISLPPVLFTLPFPPFTTISVPSLPEDLASTPDGAFVYVATNTFVTGVVVISTATNTLVTRIEGPFGTDLAITPDGASTYVSGSETVYAIDTASNTQSAAITFPSETGGIAVQPDGAFVWVPGYTFGAVPLIDTATNTSPTTINTGGQPLDVAFAVKTPPLGLIQQLIDDIEALVANGDLASNKGDALINKLEQVIARLEAGQGGAACNQLGAFINQVNAYISSGALTPAQGQSLISAVNLVRGILGC